MRWLIVNTFYGDFLRSLYASDRNLARQPYEAQLQALLNTRFGSADFHSYNLRQLGHEAHDVIANAEELQRCWATEHGIRRAAGARWPIRRARPADWVREILAAQVNHYRPDVLYCFTMAAFDSDFLRRVHGAYRIAVAEHSSMIPPVDVRAYDLVLSSLPNLVDHFRAHGMRSEYFRLGFDTRVLADLNGTAPAYDVVFVGGLSGIQHDPGARLLEQVCGPLKLQVWGYGAEGLPPDSPLRAHYRGPLWGRDMYRVFRAAKIVLNRHGPIALHYANNLRLFEATGVGALLLTDDRQNLPAMFEPGREVVTYRDAEDCARRARYYLDHETERAAIAQAGQQRTLREHTYAQRMREAVEIVSRYL